jgi:hypothetical protein
MSPMPFPAEEAKIIVSLLEEVHAKSPTERHYRSLESIVLNRTRAHGEREQRAASQLVTLVIPPSRCGGLIDLTERSACVALAIVQVSQARWKIMF